MISNNSHTPFFKLIPSLVTLLALCVGLSAIKFALNNDWQKATFFILFAAFLDGVDGRLARFFEAESKMGAELDSLADFVNFGFIPVFIVYLWLNQFSDVKFFDWGMVLLFSISMAIRLARFNTKTKNGEDEGVLEKYFFQGIAAPASAGVTILPILFSYQFGYETIFAKPAFVISYVCLIAILTSSTIPTISIKKIPISNKYFYLILIILVIVMIFLVTRPWITLLIVGGTYLLSIPFTAYCYWNLKRKLEK